MRNEIQNSESRKGKEGIALVIVLGLLSVMVVLAVAFSISMRTERMATRSYVDVVKARQLVHTALFRVLGDNLVQELNGTVYPPWDAFAYNAVSEIDLLGDKTDNSGIIFIPGSLRQAAVNADGVEWLPLIDAYDDNTFYGEYAFLVVNCSGLVDANEIGGREDSPGPRLNGINPEEIRFHQEVFPEMLDTAAPENLERYRNEFRRFESVSELYFITTSADFKNQTAFFDNKTLGTQPFKSRETAYLPWVDNFHVYSRAPRGYAELDLTANTNVAYIGGKPVEWTTDDIASIKSALEDISGSGQAIPDLDAFVGVIYDYANEEMELYGNTEEEKLDRISSKAVPMINEVIVTSEFSLELLADTTYNFINTIYLTVETWYPFPEAGEEEFILSIGSGTEIPQIVAEGIPMPAYSVVPEFSPKSFKPDANSFQTNTIAFRSVLNIPAYPEGNPIPTEINVTLDKELSIKYNAGEKPKVDRVLPNWPKVFSFIAEITLSDGSTEVSGVQAASVNDPRINWDPSLANQWSYIAATPNKKNNGISGKYTDEYDFMFARRTPFVTIGELGYLLFDKDKPWETIRLIGSESRATEVIDRLTTTPASLYPRRGLVNPNTRQTNALVATLWTAPVRRYSGDPTGVKLDIDQTRLLANYMIERMITLGPITNSSQIANRLTPAGVDPIIGSADNKFLRESVIRNSLGLWSPRQQLYTIYLAARTFSDAYDPNDSTMFANRDDYVTAEQRAISIVWRDPLETIDAANNVTHQSYVQFFHWFHGAFWDE